MTVGKSPIAVKNSANRPSGILKMSCGLPFNSIVALVFFSGINVPLFNNG
jgi:hypothetical protein